jgi:hypothetical protein
MIYKNLILMYTKMNLGETTTVALLTGGIAAAGSMLLFGETGNTTIGGISLPTPVIIGASAGVSSWASDAVSDMIIKKLPQSVNYANAEKLAVKLGVCGATTAIALKVTTGLPNENLIKAVALGAAARAAADWTNNNVINSTRSGFLVPL